MQWDLKETERCVVREIIEAKSYKDLLFNLVEPLRQDEALTRLAPIPLYFMMRAFELGCVLALMKIFARDKEPGLDRLIQMARNVSPRVAEAKLSNAVKDIRDKLNNERTSFLSKIDAHRKRIDRIRRELGPLRNTQRAHNYPELAKKATTTTWNEFQEWLTFAGEVYQQAMSAAGEGSLPISVPVTFKADVQNMLDIIDVGKKTVLNEGNGSVDGVRGGDGAVAGR